MNLLQQFDSIFKRQTRAVAKITAADGTGYPLRKPPQAIPCACAGRATRRAIRCFTSAARGRYWKPHPRWIWWSWKWNRQPERAGRKTAAVTGCFLDKTVWIKGIETLQSAVASMIGYNNGKIKTAE